MSNRFQSLTGTVFGSVAAGFVVLFSMQPALAQLAQQNNQFGPGVPVVTDWSGPYLGVAAGLTASSVSGISSLSAIKNTYDSNSLQGSLIGGANLQLGPVVVGAEGDVTLQNITGTRNDVAGVFTTKVDWSATLRGRLGIPFGNLLAYGTAGLALTNVGVTYQNVGRDSQLLKGWVAGVGLEAAIFGGWRLRGEYLYSKADSNRFTFGSGPTYNADAGNHTLRAALIVRFGN